MSESASDELPFDPDSAELCSDGACNGLIGGDGRCKVCGAPRGTAPDPATPVDDPYRAPGADDEAFDADQRQLCSDGACTGLCGDDGRCKVCGK